MRQLTFSGFLDRYIRELSGLDRIDIAKMAVMADGQMPRIKEPLVVYASLKRSPQTIRKLFGNTSLKDDYNSFFALCDNYDENYFMSLPENYKKLYKSYLSVRDQKENKKRIKQLYRDNILKLRNSSGITDYKICKTLNINHGNLHSFLYQGRCENISLENVRKIYDLINDNYQL